MKKNPWLSGTATKESPHSLRRWSRGSRREPRGNSQASSAAKARLAKAKRKSPSGSGGISASARLATR